ncbi:hypothetical protein [Clostridium cavendishii]|uniref:hypothetical protein n=1 Tax=Clostridium cavendishii TaxID=349931 RepID=UPI001A9A6BC5|nr:hypothetical protein [Clostridium cavendishii]
MYLCHVFFIFKENKKYKPIIIELYKRYDDYGNLSEISYSDKTTFKTKYNGGGRLLKEV